MTGVSTPRQITTRNVMSAILISTWVRVAGPFPLTTMYFLFLHLYIIILWIVPLGSVFLFFLKIFIYQIKSCARS